MVRFVIDIAAVAGDPKEVKILLKTVSNQPAEAEETAAERLLPALRDLLTTRFSGNQESLKADEIPSPH